MGSITHIVNGEGAVQNHYEYDAWGNVTEQTETVPNRFKFNGQQLDPITQQYYLRARFYNPVIARFTQEDTYRGDGLNLYAYCANNPVVYEDPTGNACEPQANILKKAKGLATFTDNSGKSFTQDANNRWHDASGRFTSDPTGVNQPKKPQAKLPTDKAGQGEGHYLHRPYIRQSTIDGVNKNTTFDAQGNAIVKDIKDNLYSCPKPDLGHVTGSEFWYERNQAEKKGITQAQFNEQMNDPKFYAWQDPARNRSHMDEDNHK